MLFDKIKKGANKLLNLIFDEGSKEPQPPQQTPKQPPQPATVEQPEAPKTYKVTGMRYYMDNIEKLAVENEDYSYSKRELIDLGLTGSRIYQYEYYPIKAELVPEPDNPYDPNAIKVLVDGLHVGHIKKGSCAHLLKVLREDRIKKIDCTIKGGKYVIVLEDYDYDRDREVYTSERDEAPISITLHITEEKAAQATHT